MPLAVHEPERVLGAPFAMYHRAAASSNRSGDAWIAREESLLEAFPVDLIEESLDLPVDSRHLDVGGYR